MLRAFLFDFDGVIIHSEPLHFRLLKQVLAEEGLPLTKDEYDTLYLAYDDRACFATALQRAGREAPEALVQELAKRKEDYFRTERHTLRPLPGAEAFVRRCADLALVGIASGSIHEEIEYVLDATGLRPCIRAIASSEDYRQGKPDPECFLICLQRLNEGLADPIRPVECLVVEDSLHGIAAARACAMRCLAVANSYPAEKLVDADRVVMSLECLDPLELRVLFESA